MDQEERRSELNRITSIIIGCVYKVSNTLGVGFLEKVYENALVYELRKAGLRADPQQPVKVFYDGVAVGEYIVDVLVEGVVLLEIKAVRELDEVHRAQCLNYLKATRLSLCLLVNFATSRAEIKRIVRDF